jgi:hypothetical protein
MDAQELPSGELLLELVDAMDRGLQASFLGDEPDVVAVRLRETDLGPAQQDHALAVDADDARRRARPALRGSIVSLPSVPKTASVPMGWSARNTGRRLIRQGSLVSPVAICVEPTQSRSRRACLVA